VQFAGRVPDEDLPRYYQACDLFAFHTLHEGFGIVLLEAMATARSVVTTRAGGTLDIVQEGENGLMAEPRDVPGFARAVITLLKDPTRCALMGNVNRRRVEHHFNWDRITEQYNSLYQQVLSTPSAPASTRQEILC
jgi:glycosyltransferase involved in cell wall biosynthesis